MSITQEERESITKRYRAILSGMGLDVGLAEGCAESEIKGKDPTPALRQMMEYQATLSAFMDKPDKVTQETKQDNEMEDLKAEIESYMLDGRGTAAYHPKEQPDNRQEDPKTAKLRNEIESIMFGSRTA